VQRDRLCDTGNLLGGFDEAKQQRMQEIIQQVLGEFSKQFPLKYKVRR
jgi:hypothetical protein